MNCNSVDTGASEVMVVLVVIVANALASLVVLVQRGIVHDGTRIPKPHAFAGVGTSAAASGFGHGPSGSGIQ